MKVALCLSGHFRSFDRTLATLKSAIIDPYRPDIFIHTWETLGYDGSDRGDRHIMRTPVNENLVKSLYQPKKVMFEPMPSWNVRKYHVVKDIGLRNPEIIFGMFYGIYKANEIKNEYEKENGFVYDVVIRCRPDIYFENTLSQIELENCLQTNGVYVPKFGNYNGLNDQFAFGSSDIMNKYCSTYLNLDKFYEMGALWHAESMMKFTANHFNISVLRSNIKYFLLRANGYAFRLAQKNEYGDVE